MSTVLVLTSSALGAVSVSNQLVQDAIALLRLQDPHLRVITRDLGGNPIPHLTVESATALRGAEPANAAQAASMIEGRIKFLMVFIVVLFFMGFLGCETIQSLSPSLTFQVKWRTRQR